MKKLCFLRTFGLLMVLTIFALFFQYAEANHLPAPKLLSPKNGETVSGVVKLQWEAVPGVTEYTYVVERYDPKFGWEGSNFLNTSKTTIVDLDFPKQNIESGTKLRWSVSFFAGSEIQGTISEWSEFVYEKSPSKKIQKKTKNRKSLKFPGTRRNKKTGSIIDEK